MKQKETHTYPRPIVASDCVVFGYNGSKLSVLLIQRNNEPFKGSWALPGGFVHEHENAEQSARRVLNEKAGISDMYIEQLYTFSDINRDPRDKVISVTYYSLVNENAYLLIAGKNTIRCKWFPVNEMPVLAFDHSSIIAMAMKRLKSKLRYEPVGFELLNEKFTIPELQMLYEAILEEPIDKRNFRKKILSMDLLVKLDEKQKHVAHKAASYYSFDEKNYKALSEKGFNFEL